MKWGILFPILFLLALVIVVVDILALHLNVYKLSRSICFLLCQTVKHDSAKLLVFSMTAFHPGAVIKHRQLKQIIKPKDYDLTPQNYSILITLFT